MRCPKTIVSFIFGVLLCASTGIAAKGAQVSDVYTSLRNMALATKPETAGASASAAPNVPFGVVTDIRVDNGFATVVANADGHASIYLSSGGGYLGGEGTAKINAAAKATVEAAASALGEMHLTKQYPLPQQDHVNFFVLTTAGVLTATAKESDLEDTSKPLGHLYEAVQNVITQYRLMQR